MSSELNPETMTVEDVTRHAAQLLSDRQAKDIVILDVEDLLGYTDFCVIVSARPPPPPERLRRRFLPRDGAEAV